MEFAVERDSRPAETVLVVRGELDIATVTSLRSAVADVLESAPPKLYVDLSGTSFIDSTGCRELVRTARAASARQVPVELVVPTGNWRVRRVIDFMQFGELLPVHDEAPFR